FVHFLDNTNLIVGSIAADACAPGATGVTAATGIDLVTTGSITLNNAVNSAGQIVRLSDTTTVSQAATGTITAGSPAIGTAGNIDLCVPGSPNSVGTFAASSTAGFVHFQDNTNLVVGSIAADAYAVGATGVTAATGIDLVATGSLTLNNAVSSAGQIVRLNAGTTVSQAAARTITAPRPAAPSG